MTKEEFEIRVEQYKDTLSKEEEVYLEEKRQKFLSLFPAKKIDEIPIEKYALGTEVSKESFCYWLETELERLGDIHGSPSNKFAVYYGKRKPEVEEKWRWNKWTNEDFSVVQNELRKLIEAGKNCDIKAIEKNKLSPMFKGKILACYYPDSYLNIYSEKYVVFLLRSAYNDHNNYSLEEGKQKLIEYKNNHPKMKHWSNLRYTFFLNEAFDVKRLTKEALDDQTIIIDGKKLIPINTEHKYESLNKKKKDYSVKISEKLDYEKIAKQKATIGKIGEAAVVEFEKNRLIKAGKRNLAQKVKWISQTSDSYGYDIRSFYANGEEKHIEVKTSNSSKPEVHFFISANEYEKMCLDDQYEIYYVYDLKGKPKVYILDCEVLKNHFDEFAVPVTYKVDFTSKDIKDKKYN